MLIFGYLKEFDFYYRKLLEYTSYEVSNESDHLNKFTYQLKSSKELVQLREKYKLDIIAGETDEINQLKNLTRWLNSRHPHGNVAPPKVCNALAVLEQSDDKQVPMNCYVLATVLNEIFLSLGFQSRRVHCRSYDAYDLDSHVVTAVYLRTLGKWVFFDPSWSCFITDDIGAMLSLEEFRDRISNNLPVWVNGEPVETEWSQFYKGYMAKNMFWFYCPIDSEYDNGILHEGNKQKYALLLPEKYMPLELKGNDNFQYTICRNPRDFWIPPKASDFNDLLSTINSEK